MLIQSNIPDRMCGRVMSVYTLVIFGTFPLGSLIAGALAEYISAPWAVALSAAVVLLVGLGIRFSVPQMQRLQ